MPIVGLPELLADAEKGRYAVGYFESWDIYSLEATLAAAEAERSPVIIGIGGLSANHQWLSSVGVELYGAACQSLARRATVPTAILFNEGESFTESAGALGVTLGEGLGDALGDALDDGPVQGPDQRIGERLATGFGGTNAVAGAGVCAVVPPASAIATGAAARARSIAKRREPPCLTAAGCPKDPMR